MNQPQISVVIADDHDIFRDGLKKLLDKTDGINLIGEARDGKQLIDLVKFFEPDVVLTDLRMPVLDGIQAINEITNLKLKTKCVALSTYDYDKFILDAVNAGAFGYVLKNANKNDIIEAIKAVSRRETYYCASTTRKIAIQLRRSHFNPVNKEDIDLFTNAEREVIRLICEEQTSEEIGKQLFSSKRTIEKMRIRILDKAGVKTSLGLLKYALKNALYVLEE